MFNVFNIKPLIQKYAITINTEATTPGAKQGAIPFNLYNNNNGETLTVDWGDGTVETLTKSSFSSSGDTSPIIHTYTNAGTYHIVVEEPENNWNSITYKTVSSTISTPSLEIATLRDTLVSIDKPLPTFSNNTSNYRFLNCVSLTTLPQNLFAFNTSMTDFSYCFSGCTSLATLPSDLFSYNTSVTGFWKCFSGCSSLTSIPSGLFDNCTTATIFNCSFENCSSLEDIPTDLFKYNTNITEFTGCFLGCSSLSDFTIHIGSSSVSWCNTFVTNKAGTTRTVYVPNNSTTKTTFEGVASELGLTIIGE